MNFIQDYYKNFVTPNKYLNKEDLINAFGTHEISLNDLISSDSYDEEGLLNKIKQYNDIDQELLLKAAIQIAIIGAGNKNYGAIKHKEEVILLTDLFKRLNVSYSNVRGSNLKPDELTPRRLTRLFRFHIQEFIQKTGRPSYLWLKYSTRDQNMLNICFPSAEHLIDTAAEFEYLVNTYKTIDGFLNTRFIARLERVGIARGLVRPIVANQ